MTQAHQEANQQVETPVGARLAVVFLWQKEFLQRSDQLPEQQMACCLTQLLSGKPWTVHWQLLLCSECGGEALDQLDSGREMYMW